MGNNILIFGVGKTGSRLFVNILETFGWNSGDTKEGVRENIWAQNINKQILLESNICECGIYTKDYICNRCNRNLRNFNKMPLDTKECILSIQQPWILKDPRFVLTLGNSAWQAIWDEYKPLMIYITRDLNYLRKKYTKIWKQLNNIYGKSFDELIEIAKDEYKQWKYSKVHISFEQLIEAGKLIDFIRAINI